MGANYKYITEKQLGMLSELMDWKIWELPPAHWDQIPDFHRKKDAIGVFVSGSFNDPKVLNGHLANVGIDIVVHEEFPTKKGEGHINIYHSVFAKLPSPLDGDKTFLMATPYRADALMPHYPEEQPALNFYSAVGTLWTPAAATNSESFESRPSE